MTNPTMSNGVAWPCESHIQQVFLKGPASAVQHTVQVERGAYEGQVGESLGNFPRAFTTGADLFRVESQVVGSVVSDFHLPLAGFQAGVEFGQIKVAPHVEEMLGQGAPLADADR